MAGPSTLLLLGQGTATADPYLGPQPVDLSPQGTVLTANSDATIVSQINAQTAGNTVQIAGGNYGALTVSKSIASGLIRIVPAPGERVTFASINLDGAQGLDFRGISVTGAGVGSGTVVYFGAAVRCRWRGGTHYVPATATCFEVRNGSSDVIVEDFTVVGALNSLYVQGFTETGRATGIIFQRFLSVNVAQDHCFLSRGDNITVQDFVMHGHTESTEHQDGVQIVGVKSSTIRRGHIYNTRAFRDAAVDRNDHGVLINYDPAETPEGRVPQDITLEDLLIHDMTSTGVAVAGCLGVTLQNVTSYDNGSGGTADALIIDPDPGNTVNGVVLRNSVFNKQVIDAAATITTNAYNFVADGSGPSGTNELTGSPGFVDSANQNYALAAGSQLRNSGTSTGAPTADLYGTAFGSPPSRGAIESGSTSGGASTNPVVRSRTSAAVVGPTGSLAVDKPSGASVGDRLVITQWQTSDGAAASMTAPDGTWVQVGTTGVQDSAGIGMRGKVWEHTVTGSEGATFTFGFDPASSVDGMGLDCECWLAGTFAPGAAFWDVAPTWGGSTTTATAQVAPTVTTVAPNALLVAKAAEHSFNNVNTYTAPGGMTERLDLQPVGNYISITSADEPRPSAGATGTRTFTATRAAAHLTLSYSVAPSTAATAAFSGSGSLTAAGANPAATQGAAFSGSGSLSAPASPAVALPAPLSGSGTLSASTTPAVARTAALSGSGTLTTGQTPAVARAAALSGTGTLQASTFGNVTAALSGSGTLAAITVPGWTRAAAFSGSGSLTTAQLLGVSRAAALSGSGSLTAVKASFGLSAVAVLSGQGTLAAEGFARYRYSVWTGSLYRPLTPHVLWQGSWRSDIPVNLIPADA